MEEEKFDGILYTMVQNAKGYEGFFEYVFGFLSRKTDFFSDVKKAEEILAKVGLKYIKKSQEKIKKEEESVKNSKSKVNEFKEAEKPFQKEKEAPKAEVKKEEDKKIEVSKDTAEKVPKKESENGKLLPNKGNGSNTENYIWTQTLTEVQISIPVDKNIRAKDLNVTLNLNNASVSTKDKKKTFLEGEWFDKIHPDDSMWTIEEVNGQKTIEITIQKWKNTNHWWGFLIKGEPEIDTQKINPESSKLSDLDGDMRSTVEKMMFDMNQKQKGLPSSEELQKQEKLKEFMKAHPEMDFSKAKFA